MKIAKRITIAHPPLRLNYVASFAIRSIPHYPDGRSTTQIDKANLINNLRLLIKVVNKEYIIA